MTIETLHKDPQFIVVNKPSGLLSVPGIGPEKADCLVARLQVPFPGCRIVHRLDRDTSGVMVLAFDADAHRNLSIQFQDRKVQKTYEAVVAGIVEQDEGLIDLPIAKDRDNAPRQKIDHEHGRPSQTHYRVLNRDKDRTRLELRPVTGRSHQLRLHLLELGHPILGDDLYAPPEIRAVVDRLHLHSVSLRFAHPGSGEQMTFESKSPF